MTGAITQKTFNTKEESSMSTSKITISIPEYMLSHVHHQMGEVGYASVSEYIRELIRRDLRESGRDRSTIMAAHILRASLNRPVDR